jgi:hypothetical protein
VTFPPTFDPPGTGPVGDTDVPSPVVVLAELTGHLAAGVDAPYLLHLLATRTREALRAAAVSVVFDGSGSVDLDLVAAASTGLLDRSLSVGGPVAMCVRTGAAVLLDDLENAPGRWQDHAREARAAGIGGMPAYPARIANRVIGAVVVHTSGPWRAPGHAAAFVLAVADLAALAVSVDTEGDVRLSVEATRRQQVLEDAAVIDQAIGVLAETHGLAIGPATDLLVTDARRSRTSLADRARAVIDALS